MVSAFLLTVLLLVIKCDVIISVKYLHKTLYKGETSCNSSISSSESSTINYPYHLWTLPFDPYKNQFTPKYWKYCHNFVNIKKKHDTIAHIYNFDGTEMDQFNSNYKINSTYYIQINATNKYVLNISCYSKCDQQKQFLAKRLLQSASAISNPISNSVSDSSDEISTPVTTTSLAPSNGPSIAPSNAPSNGPSIAPSNAPSNAPSISPSIA
eukprot:247071_1